MTLRWVAGTAAVIVLASAGSVLPAGELAMPRPSATPVANRVDRAALPLVGRTIVIDAGHQLGNHNYPVEIGRHVQAGGFRKPCNATGAATDDGLSEATFTIAVARLVRERLVLLGASVIMTRSRNREDLWGPCVDRRGRAGNAAGADLKLSIHADGSWTGRGFHVIAPSDRAGWTDDIFRPSRRLALVVRRQLAAARLPYADYVAGGDGLAFRADLATLNLSDVPAVMVELGNMRAARDARLMTSDTGRRRYAGALVRAVRAYFQTRT